MPLNPDLFELMLDLEVAAIMDNCDAKEIEEEINDIREKIDKVEKCLQKCRDLLSAYQVRLKHYTNAGDHKSQWDRMSDLDKEFAINKAWIRKQKNG